jgi:hypothetical protein
LDQTHHGRVGFGDGDQALVSMKETKRPFIATVMKGCFISFIGHHSEGIFDHWTP